MTATDALYLGHAESGPQTLLLKYANRHGLIAGATGTGKTLTLQGLAEGFSAAGVPVFIADVKGDLSGLCAPGADKPALVERARQIGFTLDYRACPVLFWDVFGKIGHPVRTTITEMGPLMLARLLALNPTQEAVLTIAFTVADSQGLLLLDMNDLRAMLTHLSENASEYSSQYGNIAPASVAAIQRALLALESQGAKELFGEPALKIEDLLRIAPGGQGAVNILSAESLMQTPKLYATLLLWLLSELFEDLPEVGDLEKPKLVFFFDEAHLLFSDAPKALIEKIEQLVRLIRSKGVGVYFITQNPADIPAAVLSQLSNRVQHALRAFTPQDQKGVKAAAQTFRPNPNFKTEEAITNLGIGEALVSTLDAKGSPTVVERTLIRPPLSYVGPVSAQQRQQAIVQSPIAGVYEQEIDRESAYEMLTQKTQSASSAEASSPWGEQRQAAAGGMPRTGSSSPRKSPGRPSDGLVTAMAKSAVRSVGNQLARELVRGLLGALKR